MNQLTFRKPVVAINASRADIANLQFAEDRSDGWNLRSFDEILALRKTTPSLCRNIVAYYLRVSCVPIREIASQLSISNSRVSAVVAKGRRAVLKKSALATYRYPSYEKRAEPHMPKKAGVDLLPPFTTQQRLDHRLREASREVADAEAALSWLHRGDDIYLVSTALSLGRAHFRAARLRVSGALCLCMSCKLEHQRILEKEALNKRSAELTNAQNEN